MTTLTSIWRRVLPFGFIAENVPAASSVRQYTMTFTSALPILETSTVLLLVFMDSPIVKPSRRDTLRATLLEDEADIPTPGHRRAREEGLHVVSTFEWFKAQQTATFWLRRDLIEGFKAQGDRWGCAMYRSDTWSPQSMAEKITQVRDVGVSWTD